VPAQVFFKAEAGEVAARNGVSGTHMLLWLPHFHDFCLTVGILGCGMKGYPLVLMSPLHFIAKPTRWLDFMARHKTSHTVGPDFAFGLLSRSAPSHLIPLVTPDLLHSKEVCCFVHTSQQRMLLSRSSPVLGALLR
jgi:acyl-CoA synthetase (AMP-forming)/AMP-acid ligase II